MQGLVGRGAAEGRHLRLRVELLVGPYLLWSDLEGAGDGGGCDQTLACKVPEEGSELEEAVLLLGEPEERMRTNLVCRSHKSLILKMAAVTTMQMQMDKFKDQEHNPQKASGIGLPGIVFNAVLLGYFCHYLNYYHTGCWADKEGTF